MDTLSIGEKYQSLHVVNDYTTLNEWTVFKVF